ncbi:hypothetical protein D9613_006453 [Agrocybe pediades]|uniref:Uncharacterized protein n=1 Tax=Agrocybe pediades TaxID=84607 RepID=A0A8H4QHS2_9AGAR|nr:hypothetical protein D9613_006453 [Agrocybe pediades]
MDNVRSKSHCLKRILHPTPAYKSPNHRCDRLLSPDSVDTRRSHTAGMNQFTTYVNYRSIDIGLVPRKSPPSVTVIIARLRYRYDDGPTLREIDRVLGSV